jgi:hypothetical protein
MTTSSDRISFLLARRPFVVLGYSAADSVWCPTCLRTAAGLSPGRPDYDGKPILPLFAREPTVREEMCDACGQQLMQLLAERAPEAPAFPRSTVRARLLQSGRCSAIRFDRVPPVAVRSDLKTKGWRWHPRFRVWWSPEATPSTPDGVDFIRMKTAPNVSPRPPVVRRRGTTMSRQEHGARL